jgi:hypothetical protein
MVRSVSGAHCYLWSSCGVIRRAEVIWAEEKRERGKDGRRKRAAPSAFQSSCARRRDHRDGTAPDESKSSVSEEKARLGGDDTYNTELPALERTQLLEVLVSETEGFNLFGASCRYVRIQERKIL